ncbi:ABC transporter ATP-binding protein [Pseudoclavibacter endophyticus]|uniref:ABC transporter ATP-binding protein n=1 Tax=Pseudoclavibacter endophyticus TaxID=1778590 RepID=A0A6H9WJF1_9MICO|nr:ABC transporter ATP-binding protein [Pseudoclavibacter endophyticus]
MPDDERDEIVPALDVSRLRVAYGETAVVQGSTFAIAPGEVVALVGESGSGKTTTAQAVLGLLPPEAEVEGGSVRLAGESLLGLDERRLRELRGRRIGYVPQDPASGLNPVVRVGRQIDEVLRSHRLGPARERRGRVLDALRQAGIADAERVAASFPHQLSGGMQQRALIAQALVAGPELIVADEPTSALDVTVQQEVLDNLGRAADELGVALLLITHDLAVAAERADRVLVLRDGRIVEQGDAAAVLRAPTHAYTRELVAASPAVIADSLRDREERAVEAPGFLRVEGLRRRFTGGGLGSRGAVVAVDDVSFEIPRGHTLALVGESGSGKTTTARIVSRLERADAGEVMLDGRPITGLRGPALREFRRRVQYVHQHPRTALNPRFTVAQAVGEPLGAFGVAGGERLRRVRELLERVALPEHFAERTTAELSGGQAQRVAIARALALDPEVIVLDEAVSALDVAIQAKILDLLAALQAEAELTYLFVTHDLAVVAQIADRVAVMRSGEVVEAGTARRVFESPEDPYTQRLLAAVPGMRGVA